MNTLSHMFVKFLQVLCKGRRLDSFIHGLHISAIFDNVIHLIIVSPTITLAFWLPSCSAVQHADSALRG